MGSIQEILDAVVGFDSLDYPEKLQLVENIKTTLINGTSFGNVLLCNRGLMRLSSDKDWRIRKAVAKTLIYVVEPDFFSSLVSRLLEDKHRFVKSAAIDIKEQRDEILKSDLLSEKSRNEVRELWESIADEHGKQTADQIFKVAEKLYREMSSSTAHRLRNIKSPIVWNVNYIEKKLLELGINDDEISVSMDDIRQKMNYFINILKDLSKVALAHHLKFETVNILSLINEAVNGIKNRISEEGIVWKGNVNITIDESLEMEMARHQMYEVFFNLIKNALEAQNMDGDISVVVKEKNNIIHVAVQDTGLGILEGDKNSVFYPSTTSKQDKGGTGFGLFNARMFIHNHGGEVTLESERGKGTTINIELPKMQRNE